MGIAQIRATCCRNQAMLDARMRVLHIGKFFPPHPGGIERYCAGLATALNARGVAAALLAHDEPGTWRSRQRRVDDVEITLAACHGQLLYAPISPTFPLLLARALRSFKPDLLHLHLPNTSAFWALLAGLLVSLVAERGELLSHSHTGGEG